MNRDKGPKDKRKQIHDEAEAKFIINNAKRAVFVKNLKNLKTLSEYLDFDLQKYFSDYNPMNDYSTDFEMIIECPWKSSVVESHYNDFTSRMQGGLGLSITENWKKQKQNSVSLQAFMEPEGYPEEFI